MASTVDVGQRQRDVAHKRDKCLPRERINRVLDPGTPFLEVGQLAGYNALGDEESVPSGNVIAGVGVVRGKQCMLVANNYVQGWRVLSHHRQEALEGAGNSCREQSAMHLYG